MAPQSDTTNPSKASSPFRTSVTRYALPCILSPFQLLNETMIVRAPAVIAAW